MAALRHRPADIGVLSRLQACDFSCVIPEIDIWRAANLILKRYGDKALENPVLARGEPGNKALSIIRDRRTA
jgi:hypothetical protein